MYPGLVSCPFYAIPIYPFKFMKFFIYIMSTGLPRPGLARSAHRGRIKLLNGYVSKSSAALNPLMITQIACER